jgi:CBS domain-containing protein
MSARAAWRLESLGFAQVFRYTPGKQDWFAAGWPRDGRLAAVPRAIDAARTDVPTCGLAEAIGAVRARLRAAGWDQCLVVNARRVVLGRLRGKGLAAADETPAEEGMEPGPTTFRPNGALGAIAERMRDRKVGSVVITASDGELLGVLFGDDAELRLANAATAPRPDREP